jgi:hypothetical protein
MLLKKGLNVLPCAGITLIRFYGFDLSPAAAGNRHPGNLVIAVWLSRRKCMTEIILKGCNFSPPFFVSEKAVRCQTFTAETGSGQVSCKASDTWSLS